MIRLIDLIELAGVKLKNYKLHLATGTKTSPLNAFYEGTFQQWQNRQHRKNFECDEVIGLIHMGADRWLFAGVWKVHGCRKRREGYLYKTSEITGLEHLAGRVVVTFNRAFRASYVRGEKYGPLLLVRELRPERLAVEEFPGYSAASLPFDMLRVVIRQRPASWVTALRSVAGVYLVADTSNGKLYVGSAYGEGGFWDRWESYSRTGHGGNKELIELLALKGKEHASQFLFSILEVCDLITTNDQVLQRESHWKRVLLSREFGYNSQ